VLYLGTALENIGSNGMNAVQSRPEMDLIPERAADRRGRVNLFRRAQDWLRHGRGPQELAILNALPAHVAVIDSHGLIVSVNETWRGFDRAQAIHGPGAEVGRNYLEICDGAPQIEFCAHQIAAGIRCVLAGAVTIFSMDYACYSSMELRWFALTVTPLGDKPTRCAIVMHRDITADRRIEETVRVSETQFRQMAEHIRDVFFLVDTVSHHILYISPAYEAISGRSCESLYANPTPWSAGVHPDDRAFVQEKYETGILTGTFEYECRILRPDGALRWIEVKGSPVLDAAGSLVRVAGAMEDITPRKQAAQALQDGQRRIESLVITATDAILTVDEQRHIVLSNPAAEGMFGYTSAELHGRPIDDLLHASDDVARFLDVAEFRNAALLGDRSRAPRPITGLRRDGETFQVEASVSRFDADGRGYFTTMLRDLTERQRASDRLRECQRRLSDLLSNVELVAVMLDRTANIDYCNDYFLALTGWQRAEVLGKSFFELFIPPESRHELQGVYAAMLANLPRSRHHENSILTRSGERRFIRWNNSVLRSIQGGVIGIASIGEDITQQQRSDIHIKRLNRVYAMLSEINALIVRTPDRQELFNEACRIAVDAGMFKMAWIGVIDASTLEGNVVAWYGGDEHYVNQIKLTTRHENTADSRRPACRALRQSQPVICNDIATDPSVAELRDEFLEREHKSLGCFPLMISGRPMAVLSLYAAEADAFDEAEARLLTELAGNISFALDHLQKQERLNYLAHYDDLTGLANRRLLFERVAQHIRGASAIQGKVALGIIDLERFKNINQSLGRPSGDALLQQVGEWLTHKLGDATLLARVGGDHFAVVFPKVKPEGDLEKNIEQTMESFLRHPFRLNDAVLHIGAKVGVALYPDDGADADTLVKNAEAALRKAKATGDRCLFYARNMTETMVGRLNLEILLREALAKEQFVLYYQPKMNLLSGKITGAEALIRWNDPRIGLVLPGKFIPMLEETGLIHEVGRWALRRAIEDYLRWRSSGLSAVRVSVNVSPLQLRSRGFIDEVKRALAIDTAAASGLELEITESVIMEDVRHSGASLRALRAMGVSIAIDDFGTGFSSLSYLSKLPLDTLKIDRSFVNDMTAGGQGTVLVSSIINLAHSLKLNVVAEGVETQEQSALLHALGCDELQGYLLGKPAPTELFESTYLSSANLASKHSADPAPSSSVSAP
jgi:diguanylate cyclase (GGDEF)-like protein/PAS domain S-box-containing protein